MNIELVTRLLNEGKALMLVEWRGAKVDELDLADKVSGRREHRIVVRHALEAGSSQVSCAQWLPAGSKVDDIRIPYTKGQVLLVVITGLSRQKGAVSLSGEFVDNGS
ncbi:hypothetical protein [Candidatus Magnetobacterium casense]|uniref:Uncharacterized protein n=1 Tax=Candidatus Magnetobacterium casense TaxID=1455061 RepID=A0ABS6S3T4_9BACT|nr:hypothetical protein [Candidatus Magnetobacterium casensis]MBV6343517.1 hypothetical protein [Candidatus Magnetobacterium casensis]